MMMLRKSKLFMLLRVNRNEPEKHPCVFRQLPALVIQLLDKYLVMYMLRKLVNVLIEIIDMKTTYLPSNCLSKLNFVGNEAS